MYISILVFNFVLLYMVLNIKINDNQWKKNSTNTVDQNLFELDVSNMQLVYLLLPFPKV